MSGTAQVTADGVVGISGKPIRVNSICVKSGATAAVVLVLDGSTSGGTEYDRVLGVINQSVVVNYEGGLYLPDGLYINLDANTTYVTVNYDQVTR